MKDDRREKDLDGEYIYLFPTLFNLDFDRSYSSYSDILDENEFATCIF